MRMHKSPSCPELLRTSPGLLVSSRGAPQVGTCRLRNIRLPVWSGLALLRLALFYQFNVFFVASVSYKRFANFPYHLTCLLTLLQKHPRTATVSSALAMTPLESAYPAWMPGLSDSPEHVGLQAPLTHREREPIRDFENEVELESSMHVTWFSSMQCEAAYGFPQLQSAPNLQTSAPAGTGILGLPSLPQSALTIQHANSSVNWPESPRALAACLATPIEPPTELPERPQNRLISTSNGAGARWAGFIYVTSA